MIYETLPKDEKPRLLEYRMNHGKIQKNKVKTDRCF